ncbi:MAG: lysoplasmalogenase family protein [Blautia hansenii]
MIGWILSKSRFYLAEIILWLILMGICLFLFREEVKGARENPKQYAMLLYPAVLMGMTVLALSLPFRLGKEYGWIALGAGLFAVSDMMVGKSFFHEQTKGIHYLALGLYYSGIYCFALMMWM